MTYTLTILKWRIGPPSFFLYYKNVCISVRDGARVPMTRVNSEKTIAEIEAKTEKIALAKARLYIGMIA